MADAVTRHLLNSPPRQGNVRAARRHDRCRRRVLRTGLSRAAPAVAARRVPRGPGPDASSIDRLRTGCRTGRAGPRTGRPAPNRPAPSASYGRRRTGAGGRRARTRHHLERDRRRRSSGGRSRSVGSSRWRWTGPDLPGGSGWSVTMRWPMSPVPRPSGFPRSSSVRDRATGCDRPCGASSTAMWLGLGMGWGFPADPGHRKRPPGDLSGRPLTCRSSWWARTVSNRRHSPCKGDALPLSYAPRTSRQPTLPGGLSCKPVSPGKKVRGGQGTLGGLPHPESGSAPDAPAERRSLRSGEPQESPGLLVRPRGKSP